MSLTVIGLSLLIVTTATAEQLFMLSCPKELRIGMEWECDMTLKNSASSDVQAFISIRETEDSTSELAWSEAEFIISIGVGSSSGQHSVKVPALEVGQQYYVHTSNFGLHTSEQMMTKVLVTNPSQHLLITTDKPLYTPGSEVHFRVVSLENGLKPMDKPVTVTILDPKKTSIMKLDSSDNTEYGADGKALVDGSFTVLEDQELGMYTIAANASGISIERQFEIKEYVLPKYEVMIELDKSYAIQGTDQTTITGKIKAKYSYGEDVKGEAVLKLNNRNDVSPILMETKDFDGSVPFSVNVKSGGTIFPYFGFDRDSYMRSDSIAISAEVKETNGEKVEYTNATVTVYPKAFAATVVKPLPMLFKGKNFTFEVKLTNPMGGMLDDWDKNRSPMSNDLSYYTLFYKAASGEFASMVMSQNPQPVTLMIKTSDDSLYENNIEVYIQYTDANEKKVDSQKVKENIAKYYTWSGETLGVELVESQNQNEVCFKITPFKTGDFAFYQLVNNYYPEQRKVYGNVDGHCFTPEQQHAPTTRILAYKMVEFTNKTGTFNELLSVFVDAKSQWTPEQEVTLSVTHGNPERRLKPKENVTITVQTKGQCLVGLKGVDKSVSFLSDADNDVTIDQLEKLVQAPRLFDRPEKRKEKKDDGPIMPFGKPVFRKKRCSACISSEQYMDAKKLLEDSGLTIVTNLVLKRHEKFENIKSNYEYYPDYRRYYFDAPGMEAESGIVYDAEDQWPVNDDRVFLMAAVPDDKPKAREDQWPQYEDRVMMAVPNAGGGFGEDQWPQYDDRVWMAVPDAMPKEAEAGGFDEDQWPQYDDRVWMAVPDAMPKEAEAGGFDEDQWPQYDDRVWMAVPDAMPKEAEAGGFDEDQWPQYDDRVWMAVPDAMPKEAEAGGFDEGHIPMFRSGFRSRNMAEGNLAYNGVIYRKGGWGVTTTGTAPTMVFSTSTVSFEFDDDEVAEAGETDTNEVEEQGGEQAARTYFPETWIWDLRLTNANGELTMKEQAPDSITSWEVSAWGMNQDYGLSVSETKEVPVFQPFFLSMEIPYSVVRGEKLQLLIRVFNYESTESNVAVTLENTVNYTIVDRMAVPRNVRVPAGSSAVTRWLVSFNTIGNDIPLKAEASSGGIVDKVERMIIVEAEGREIQDDDNMKMPAQGKIEMQFNMSKFFQEKFIVSGSERMYFCVTGDMMGVFIANIETKIKMPFGCGEQNIKSLTPSVFIARYLKKTGRLEAKTEAKIGKVCGAGYRKELNYKHADGSYSAFGDRDSMCACGTPGRKWGSTWLTAYVLKVFSLMYIDKTTHVDLNVLEKSFDYIVNNVTYSTCEYQYVVEKGELIHTEMQRETATRFGLVAFTVIAVMDYKDAALEGGLTDSAIKATGFVSGATVWLKNQKEELLQNKSPYQLAIVAYVLARGNLNSADSTSIELLEALAKLNETMEARPDMGDGKKRICMYKPGSGQRKVCTQDSECGDNMECCQVACESTKMCSRKPYQPRFDHHRTGSTSSQIETMGYTLMAYLELYQRTNNQDYKKMADDLKDRLLKMRKGNGFFSSTQDTVVALEALARYAMVFQSDNGADFKVKAMADGKVVTDEVIVSNANYTVTTCSKVNVEGRPEVVSAMVTAPASGGGTAYVNLMALYNVNENMTVRPYDISIESYKEDDKFFVKACFKKNPDIESGSMIVTSFDPQTGYAIGNIKLESTTDMEISPERSQKTDSGGFDVYYNKKDDDFTRERCMRYYIDEEFYVEDRKASVFKVMDYYITEQSVEALYSVDTNIGQQYTEKPPTIGASSAHLNIFLLVGAALFLIVARFVNLE